MIYKTKCKNNIAFFKLVSGLHTNINIQLSNKNTVYDNKLNQTRSFNNISAFYEKVGNHSDRIDNLFFLNTQLIKQMMRLQEELINYNFSSGNITHDRLTRTKLIDFYNQNKINISDYIVKDKSIVIFNNFNDIISRLEGVIKYLDCIYCEKSQLDSKIQLLGLITMLKFSNEKVINLNNYSRNEIIVSFKFYLL